MRVSCHFASIHRIDGLTLPTSTPRLALVETADLRVILATQVDDLCADLDVSRALATLLLRGMLRAERPNFDAGLAAEVKTVIEHRHREGRDRLLLFIESTAPADFDLVDCTN